MSNVLVITFWGINDPLIQTYTLPYVHMIKKCISPNSKIYLFTFEKKTDILNKSAVIEQLKLQGIMVISSEYKKFGLNAVFNYCKLIINLTVLCYKKKIKYIHTWCTPAGALGYIISVITGRRLIIDSFEPHAEPMVEGKTWKKNSISYKILFGLEKLQLKRASEVICANKGMPEYAKQVYGIEKHRYFIKPACVDFDKFVPNNEKINQLRKSLKLENSITCVYAGKFGGLYLQQETFNFFKSAFDFWGEKFRILLLTNHTDKEINEYMLHSGLPQNILVKLHVPFSEIQDYLGVADFAICPMKPLPSRKYSAPIKNGEYWAMGLPVVITKNISDDSDIIKNHNIGSVIEKLDYESFNSSCKKIDDLLKNIPKESLAKKIRNIAVENRSYKIAMNVYTQIYNEVDTAVIES